MLDPLWFSHVGGSLVMRTLMLTSGTLCTAALFFFLIFRFKIAVFLIRWFPFFIFTITVSNIS